jgi:hypothetical protein
MCEEYGINLAIHNHAEGASRYWHPREVLEVCEGRSKGAANPERKPLTVRTALEQHAP